MWNMNMMDDFSKQWEKMMKEWFDGLMKNPEFLENMSKSMEGALTSKTMMDELKKKMAESMSIPSASSITNMSKYLINLEAKVADLEDIIHEQNQELSEIKKSLKKIEKNKK